jgi:perosamine synthetase
MKLRTIPPAGIALTLSDILKLLRARLKPDAQADKFGKMIRDVTGARYIYFVNSGRAANFIILNSLRKLAPEKSEVIIPAYTCYSVPASIARAGLKIRPVDIDPDTLDYNYDTLSSVDYSKVLAILPCNLFGIVSDWRRIKAIASGNRIFTVDDAAQTLCLPADGGVSGTMGDLGFYSLGRGKNMTTYSGGIILTKREDMAQIVELEFAAINSPGLLSEISIFIKLLLYGMLLNPSLYWIPNSLPFLRLGYTEYEPKFEIEKLSKLQICFGPIMFSRLDKVNEIRKRNSRIIIERAANLKNYAIPGSSRGDIPYIRIPLLATDRNMRDNIISALARIGVISSGMYPSTVANIPQIEEHLVGENEKFPGAENVVDRLFTLPTHSYVRERDINNIISCLKGF